MKDVIEYDQICTPKGTILLVVATATQKCQDHKSVPHGSFELTPDKTFPLRQGHETLAKLLPLHLAEPCANGKLWSSSTGLGNLN